MTSLIAAAHALVSEAAETIVMPLFRNLQAGDIAEKSGPDDLVTVADKQAEAWLTERLVALLPGSRVVGEEAATEDPGLIDLLGTDQTVWIVDPVDGTRQFVAGEPDFGIMLALKQDAALRFAIILQPAKAKCLIAEAGEGAMLLVDGRRRQLCRAKAETRLPRFGALNLRRTPAKWVTAIEQALDEAHIRTRDEICSAAEYMALAEGESEFVTSTMMMPWDHAPGALILSELGGASRALETGRDYTPGVANSPHLMVADEAMWEPMARSIRAHLASAA